MDLSLRPLSIDNRFDRQISAPLANNNSSVPNTPNFGSAYTVTLSAQGKAAAATNMEQSPLADKAVGSANDTKKANGAECQTCKSRKYQDGSNESNVSFKTPGHIAPENSTSAVLAHEREHVNNALNEDKAENKKLLSSSVHIYTATCPECGRTYTAGGETQTVMRTTLETKSAMQDTLGKNVDIAA